MRRLRRPAARRVVPPTVPGERVLAWAESPGGWVAGTREALYLPLDASTAAPHRVPWHDVETAEWDAQAGALVVREVGVWGRPRPEHRLALADPGRLLQLVRERVTATIVLTRPVSLGRGRATVIGRRATTGARAVAWFVEYDVGLDPADPTVSAAVDQALAQAKADVGEG